MGGRLLKQWLDRPLIQAKQIKARQEMVASLLDSYFERIDLQSALTKSLRSGTPSRSSSFR